MTRVGWRALVVALVAVAGLALAACGGGTSKEDYAKQLTDTVKPVGEKLTSIGSEVSSAGSPEEAATKIGEAQKELEDVTAKVEDLDPPDDVKKEHDDYVEKLKALTADVGDLKSAVEEKDQAKAQEVVQKIQTDGQAVTDAEKAISDKVNE